MRGKWNNHDSTAPIDNHPFYRQLVEEVNSNMGNMEIGMESLNSISKNVFEEISNRDLIPEFDMLGKINIGNIDVEIPGMSNFDPGAFRSLFDISAGDSLIRAEDAGQISNFDMASLWGWLESYREQPGGNVRSDGEGETGAGLGDPGGGSDALADAGMNGFGKKKAFWKKSKFEKKGNDKWCGDDDRNPNDRNPNEGDRRKPRSEDQPVEDDDVSENPGEGGRPTPPPDNSPDPEPDNDRDPVELTEVRGPIRTTHDGQVIENIDLYVSSGDAITVTHDNVVIRNVRIHHEDGNGINVIGAKNVTIEQVEVMHADPPEGTDPFDNTQQINIYAYNSPDLTITDAVVRDGSSGIYLVESPGADISNVEGYNFHGPFPRGQFVQFNNSGDSTLTNFYTYNDPENSHPEDNISVFYSPNVIISNGVIDGNNSVTGVAVMFEGNSQGGRVYNVDAISQGNGSFSSYSDDVEFHSTRSFDNIYEDQGRGSSSSNALIWNISGRDVSIYDSTYTNPGNPNNIAWDTSRSDTIEISEDPHAEPMNPIVVDLVW